MIAHSTGNPVIEPGAIFIPILEELVELISVESWRDLWTYIETRSKRFTKASAAAKRLRTRSD
jgi:THO complex subunit 1